MKYTGRWGCFLGRILLSKGEEVGWNFEGSESLLLTRCALHFRKLPAGGGEAWLPPVSAEQGIFTREELLQNLQSCGGEPGSQAQARNDPPTSFFCAREAIFPF